MKQTLLLLALPLAGCVSDQTRQDTANSAAVIYNAAASLPATPQQVAIEANAAAIANAMSHPLTVTATGAAVQ
jgi:adenine deaminase